ncbi:aminotransferase class I/II-fold pyridoxal phosphate-dependent enzyme, partial [Acinetobacter baumannii]
MILPTFSPYYEYAMEGQEVIYYHLKKEEDFQLNTQDFIDFVLKSGADSVCVINPNNPNGWYIPSAEMRNIIESFKDLKLV